MDSNRIIFDFNGEEHIKKALDSARLDLSLKEMICGPVHAEVADAHRKLGDLYTNRFLKCWEEAAAHYLTSVEIIRSIDGDYTPEAANNLERAASCYGQMGHYQKALDLELLAYETILNHPESFPTSFNSIYNDIAFYYKQLGDDNKAREYWNKMSWNR